MDQAFVMRSVGPAAPLVDAPRALTAAMPSLWRSLVRLKFGNSGQYRDQELANRS